MIMGMIQSNYLPWRGYFDFIDDCDLFVFYDDVKYTHKDWRNRNRIKTENGLLWLSVPVIHDSSTKLENAYIDYSKNWINKHIRNIKQSYQKCKYFDDYAEELFYIISSRYETISRLNIKLIYWMMSKLDIVTLTRMSSEFSIEGDKYDRPLKILQHLGAKTYISGPQARPYTDQNAYQESGIELLYKSYDYRKYPQLYGEFENSISVIDLLFNCGPQSREYLKSRAPNIPASKFAIKGVKQ